MGLFGSSKETVTGSAALHCMDVYNLGNPIGDAVIEAVLTSGVPVASMQDIPGRLIQSNLNGYSLKVDRAYEYARDHYKLGLPAGATMALPLVTADEIKPYLLLDTEYPYDVLIIDHEYTPYSPIIAISAFLRNTRNYDSFEDHVGIWPPGVVYTQHWADNPANYPRRVGIDAVEVLPDEVTARITYRKYITRPVVVYVSQGVLKPYLKTIEQQEVSDGTLTEDVLIPGAVSGMLWNDDCLAVLYKEVDALGAVLPTIYLWVYHLNEYRYPELHPDVAQELSTYLPVIPIRYSNTDLTVPNETELYTTSKKLMTLLGSSFGTMGERLNANPGIADIDHAYILFGVNLQTDYVPSLFYLNHHFYQLAQNQRGTESEFLAALADPDVRDEPSNVYVYNLAARADKEVPATFEEYGLALDVVYDYINITIEEGIIGSEGHATKQIMQYEVTIQNVGFNGVILTYQQDRYKLILKAQINPYQVRTVVVHNLRVLNWVYRHYLVGTGLLDIIDDPDENGLIIPIQYQLSQQVFDSEKIQLRNAFYSDTMLMIVQSIDKIKIKWYQKGWFKIVMMIVVMVIAYWTGQYYIVGYLKALEIGIMAALYFVGTNVLIAVAASYIIDYIVKTYGEKLGIVGAIVLTIAAIIASKGAGIGGVASEYMMTTAQYMLQAATALISSANEFLLEKAEGIKNDFEIFSEKMTGLWEELEELTDLLAMKADIDPLVFTKPEKLRILPNETPTVFFNRCLGLVDNSMFSIHDEIPNFMDMRLRHTKDISPSLYGQNSYS